MLFRRGASPFLLGCGQTIELLCGGEWCVRVGLNRTAAACSYDGDDESCKKENKNKQIGDGESESDSESDSKSNSECYSESDLKSDLNDDNTLES